jgi:arginine decarboxylase
LDIWNTKKSTELYGIDNWGANFFRINKKGHVETCPFGKDDPRRVDLRDLIDDLQHRGLRSPVLVRFPDIVNARIKSLAGAFEKAFESFNYKGSYNGVFPIKVNQQRYLVEEMVEFGKATNLGLEAGSKPELLIALAVLDNPNALLVCNGFKDSEYIETALLARKLGRNTIIVVDRFSELPMIIESSKYLNIRPSIGFRVKLESKGAGKWIESSGAKSKFGLTISEILRGVELLKEENMLDCLQMTHFHIGSQITALRAIKDSLIEAGRVFVELASMGAGLKYIDVGGGLGVDYDGSQTNWENSVNYTIQEYANDVVGQIASACEEKGIPHPGIITEAGRALVAHHSVLVFDVLGTHQIESMALPNSIATEDAHEILDDLLKLCETVNPKNLNEYLQDAFRLREDGMNLFNLGYFSLKQRALMEDIFWTFCSKVVALEKNLPRPIEELSDLKKLMSDSYYCNFSLFQSAPDMWAVSQLFPIMPIHRLDEEPQRRAVLLDLTCDSDGKIDRFIDIKDVKSTLELHEIKANEPYYVGMFLLGAYQEILGDFHNLFGDTDAVHVSITEDGYTVDHVVEGDSVSDVLGYVEYDRPALIRRIRSAIEKALTAKSLTLEESKLLMRYYEVGLAGYTYLEGDADERSEAPLDGLKKIGQKQIEAMKYSSSGAV